MQGYCATHAGFTKSGNNTIAINIFRAARWQREGVNEKANSTSGVNNQIGKRVVVDVGRRCLSRFIVSTRCQRALHDTGTK